MSSPTIPTGARGSPVVRCLTARYTDPLDLLFRAPHCTNAAEPHRHTGNA